MIHSSKILNSIALGMLSVVFLTSCSSYINVNSAPDGIYKSSEPSETRRSVSNKVNPKRVERPQASSPKTETYSKFFSEQGEMISKARTTNNEVFVDVDNYSSENTTYPKEERYYEEPLYNGNNAGWGTNPTSVSVNYINTGFMGPRLGWGGFGFGFPFMGRFYGPVFRGFGYGGFYGPSFGFGYPFYNGFGGFYGAGFGGFYGNRYRGIAYNRQNRGYANGFRNASRSQMTRRAAYNKRSNTVRSSSGKTRSNVMRASSNRSNAARSVRNSSRYSNRVSNSIRVGARRTSGNYSRAGIRNSKNVNERSRSNSSYKTRSPRSRSTYNTSRTSRSSGVRSSNRTSGSSRMKSSSRAGRSSGMRSSGSSRSSSGRSSGRRK